MNDDTLRRRADADLEAMRQDGDWVNQLLNRIAKAPLIPEELIGPCGAIAAEPTEVELAVLRCVSHGLSLDETAVVLGKAFTTVQTQAGTVRRKLRAKTTAHACCEALRLGLIT